MEETYAFGFLIRQTGGTQEVCSCGHTAFHEGEAVYSTACAACKQTAYIVQSEGAAGTRVPFPHLRVLEKSDRGFRVERTNLSVRYDVEAKKTEVVRVNLKRRLEFDTATRTLKVYRADELEYDFSAEEPTRPARVLSAQTAANTKFFSTISPDRFFELISTPDTREMYAVVRNVLSESSPGWGSSSKTSYITGLAKLLREDYAWVQILTKAGIHGVGNLVNHSGFYRFRGENQVLNRTGRTPHAILQLPKSAIPHLRSENVTLTTYVLRDLQQAVKLVDPSTFSRLLQLAGEEGETAKLARELPEMMRLVTGYRYDVMRLAQYIFQETKSHQGILDPSEAMAALRDYIHMMDRMDLPFEKYPKSLKLKHDLAMADYKSFSDHDHIETFQSAVSTESYQALRYDDGKADFAIILPETPEDLVKEGAALSHCLSSYRDRVAKGNCQIAFLRKLTRLDQSLISIEVRDGRVRQVRGRYNRAPTPKEKAFVQKWAEEKRLVY